MDLRYGPGYWQGSPGWKTSHMTSPDANIPQNYVQVYGPVSQVYAKPIFHYGDVCTFCGGKGKRIDPNCPPTMGYVGPNGEGFPEIHCNPCGGTGVRASTLGASTNITMNIDIDKVLQEPTPVNTEKFEIQVDKSTGKYMVQYHHINGGETHYHTKECADLDELMKFIASKT